MRLFVWVNGRIVYQAPLFEEGVHSHYTINIPLEVTAAGGSGEVERWIRPIKMDNESARLPRKVGPDKLFDREPKQKAPQNVPDVGELLRSSFYKYR